MTAAAKAEALLPLVHAAAAEAEARPVLLRQLAVERAADGLPATTLERPSLGVIALAADLEVLFANVVAADMLARGDGLHHANGHSTLGEPALQRRLRAAVEAVEVLRTVLPSTSSSAEHRVRHPERAAWSQPLPAWIVRSRRYSPGQRRPCSSPIRRKPLPCRRPNSSPNASASPPAKRPSPASPPWAPACRSSPMPSASRSTRCART